MIDRRPLASLGHADHGWLDARHHFSFADYYDPDRMGWGSIRVWNDDIIAPYAGFPPHSHRDMEIVTYVYAGAITHRDSLGNVGRTAAGEVQVMSAASGITHSEHNAEDRATHLFQIWLQPAAKGGEPHWATRPFPLGGGVGRFVMLASGYVEDRGALPLRTPARVMAARLSPGESIEHEVMAGRHAYLVPAAGGLLLNGGRMEARDGAAIGGGTHITLTAIDACEIVMVDAA